ncbi:Neural Wiskott-Aldrich syndrome protein [Nibea albiflora]|uniref:Neural Wiskott-Aldrich syndrome protein n=1 Tax=Nibea albiflora TaxID=240163 RepID=A0ACB7FD26_NIBAL|nr:Neural Wiskott-Aldrich syndrome protein [Nibea albiflora]
MNSHPQPRRSVNVGSILLTPQENECLFGYLGRKCAEGKTMFEQELYHNFSISSSRSYFISFTGDTCQIGLNFASEEEAKRFRAAINDLLNRRQRKTGKFYCFAVSSFAAPPFHLTC